MKAKVSPMLWKKCNIAVVHYINERNIMDSMEPFHGFSTSYISNITAYALFVENDIRFIQSALGMYESNVHCSMVRFACGKSTKACITEHLEKVKGNYQITEPSVFFSSDT